ncbi:MAG: TetR/AcrR family transcriptional regulator [bacterium]|nr:TetR/AcrR family transcriptional regulator [bacterium]
MSQEPQHLESVSRPKQSRSEQTLLRLLDAAEALIEEQGLPDASIPEIVRRAGSSVGGFYARFRDKNELLRALEERFFNDLSRLLDAISDQDRGAEASIQQIIPAGADELVRVAREKRKLLAAFVVRAAQEPRLRDEALRFRRVVSERMTSLLLPRRSEIGHPDPVLGIDLAVQFALSLVFQRAVIGETRAAGRELTDADLASELVRCFLAYLNVSPRPPALQVDAVP